MGVILKEKLKLMKGALKERHVAHSKNFPSRIDSLKWRLSALDLKGEGDTLSEAELEDIHDITASIHLLSRRKWLKEGDANVNVCARVSLRVGSMSRVY
jgi:hypothetical protein